MPGALQLIGIALPIWFASVFLLQPLVASGLGFSAGYASSLIDPDHSEYFKSLPSGIYRHKSMGRREADLAYVKKLLDEQLRNLDEDQREAAKEYLRSLGYERLSI